MIFCVYKTIFYVPSTMSLDFPVYSCYCHLFPSNSPVLVGNVLIFIKGSILFSSQTYLVLVQTATEARLLTYTISSKASCCFLNINATCLIKKLLSNDLKSKRFDSSSSYNYMKKWDLTFFCLDLSHCFRQFFTYRWNPDLWNITIIRFSERII